MQTVNRTDLLALLESVSHGLTTREIIEQSSCYVFEDGEVMTYNDQVACRAKSGLKITGAVQASSFKAILERMPEDSIGIEASKGELLLTGKRRRASIRMENEVVLPFDNVERPKKWKRLHRDFIDAITMAQECVSKDENKFRTTCVNIHPKWVEATDMAQIIRFRLRTGVEEPTLVRGTAIKSIMALDMIKFAETPKWIHFKNKQGLIISCRRFIEEFNSQGITKYLKISGTKTVLPKGLAEATERANVFSSENVDNNLVQVILSPGKIRVRGEGVSGWFSETKKLKYKGPKLDFLITPTMLSELTKRYNECEVSDHHLKVNGGRFTYLACLSLTGEKKDAQDQDQQEENEGGSSEGENSVNE